MRRSTLLYAVLAIVVVVIIIVGYYAAVGKIHAGNTGSSGTVLVPSQTVDSIPGGQFDAIELLATSNCTLNGTFYDVLEIYLYLMTPAELEHLARTLVVGGYEWTSGEVDNGTITHLNLAIPVGASDFVILNPELFNETYVGFYSNLILT